MIAEVKSLSRRLHTAAIQTESREPQPVSEPPPGFFTAEQFERYQQTDRVIQDNFVDVMEELGIENYDIGKYFIGKSFSPKSIEYDLRFREGEKEDEWQDKDHKSVQLSLDPGGRLLKPAIGADVAVVIPQGTKTHFGLSLEDARRYMALPEANTFTYAHVSAAFSQESVVALLALGIAYPNQIPPKLQTF